jgi:hypothetical protein
VGSRASRHFGIDSGFKVIRRYDRRRYRLADKRSQRHHNPSCITTGPSVKRCNQTLITPIDQMRSNCVRTPWGVHQLSAGVQQRELLQLDMCGVCGDGGGRAETTRSPFTWEPDSRPRPCDLVIMVVC